MDFSENITGTPKYEVHLVHFNKSQYSLHVSVAEELLCKKYFFIICLMIKLITLHSLGKLPRILLHHIQILTSFDSNQTIVLSSTNQKSIWFLDWVRKDLQKPIVVYYGPWEGHGWCCQWVWCEKFKASQSQRIFFFFLNFWVRVMQMMIKRYIYTLQRREFQNCTIMRLKLPKLKKTGRYIV